MTNLTNRPEVVEALEWYADRVAGCRKLGDDGDAARRELDADGGQRAQAAISAIAPFVGQGGERATITNGQFDLVDYTQLGDAARRICSWVDGEARLNVYKVAKHELAAGVADERAKVVAWLRGLAAGVPSDHTSAYLALSCAANAIEKGEHDAG